MSKGKTRLYKMWVAIVAVCAWGTVFAFETHLVVESGEQGLANGSIIYGCIAYQGCSITEFTLGGSSRIHIYTSKTRAEVMFDFKQCDLSLLDVKTIQFVDKQLGIVSVNIPDSSSAKVDLAPAVLSLRHLKSSAAVFGPSVGNPNRTTMPKALLAIGVPTRGYSLRFEARSDAGGTYPLDKVVSYRDENSPVTFLESLLHEFTHVQQWDHLSKCLEKNMKIKTTFWSNNFRERAAYLQGAQLDLILRTVYTDQRRNLISSYVGFGKEANL